MLILGINGGFRQGYQDVSACLVRNGEIIAAIEEERLSRIKFSGGRLPYLSVFEVLKIGKADIKDVDVVAYHGSTWEAEIETRIADYFKYHFGYAPPVMRFHHHDCHAASAYYASGFSDALIVSMDNSGDGASLQVSEGRGGNMKLLQRFYRPDSLGVFYSLITQYCGFVKDSEEYKLMGLSSFGDRSKFNFDWLIDFKHGELKLNTDYIHVVPPKAPSLHRDEMNFNSNFISKIKAERRLPKSEFSQFYKDVAASAQKHLEDVMIKLLEHYVKQTGLNKLCFAGGVALNCVMNQRVMNAVFVDELFIQPASSDAGISLGAAWLAGLEKGVKPVKTTHTYLGNQFSNDEIRTTLINCNLPVHEVNNPETIAAKFIGDDKVIGWFNGRMEFGPRALGNRSILANPVNPAMQEIVNRKIKFRESFRPFCPSVLEEDAALYFSGKQKSAPFMTITYDVKEEMKTAIPSATHVDGTARIQTVSKQDNAAFYNLINAVKKETGHGVVLNTSFNLSHEPIVNSPRDAIATFFASGMDALLMGNFLIEKK